MTKFHLLAETDAGRKWQALCTQCWIDRYALAVVVGA
jgi:hypothetical protein